MKITPIITTYCGITPDEYADFVEYLWGGASTPQGKLRIADGHAAPYNVTFIELGNEQYNANFVEQVINVFKQKPRTENFVRIP
jgi:alpha-N-arabinofuranosidase